MSTPELRPLRVGEILDVAIKLYRSHALTLFKIVAIVVVPVQILGALVLLSVVPDITFEGDLNGGQPQFDESDFYGFLGANAVVVILSLLVIVLATAACFKAISDAYLGKRPDAGVSLRFALSRFGSLVWIAVLTSVLVFLGFLALVIPGIYLAVAWFLAAPARLTEDVKGWSALRRSRQLVRGRWWPTFGTLVVAYLIAAIVGGIIGAIFTGLLFASAPESGFANVTLTVLSDTIADIITTPFQAAVVAILYFDLRVRKEGFDLQLLAERIGERSEAPPARLGTPPPPPAE